MIQQILNISIPDFLLILVSLWNIILGFFVLSRDTREKINIFFALTSFSTSAWALGLVMFRVVSSTDLALLWVKFYYVSAALIGFGFLAFSFVFPYQKYRPAKLHKLFFYLFSFLVIGICVWPRVMIKEISVFSWGKEVTLGWTYSLYVIYFTLCMIIAFGNFIKKYRESKQTNKIRKRQIEYVFIGYILAATWGTIFNLFLPLVGNYKLIWLGPYFTLIMIGFLTYSILKHNLMNTKVVATEIFSVLACSVILTDALLSKNTIEFILKLIFLTTIIFFSVLLIKSVVAEIRSREKIEELAERLESANKELKQLDQEKTDFLNIASHQLRTPMTVIKGYISMMGEGMFGQIPPKAEDAMNKVYISNQRLIKLINDLLDISRIERGKMKYNFEKQNIVRTIEDITNEFRQTAKNKNLYLKFQKPEQEIPEITFDAEYIRQVMLNLLDNAVKYTDNGGVGVNISKKGENVKIAVKDTGHGLSKEEISKLFQRYHRGLKEGTKGLGMGLYIAKRIVNDHKGKIWVESEGKNDGSTFFIELPIRNS